MQLVTVLSALSALLPSLAYAEDPKAVLALTYQTVSDGSVVTSSLIYSDVTTTKHTGKGTTYTVNPADLAYPTFPPVPTAIAEGSPGPGLQNATGFVQEAVSLVGLFQNANSTNCLKCKNVMTTVQAAMRVRQETLHDIAVPFCTALSAFLPLNQCVGLLNVGSTDIGGIFPAMDMLGEDGQLLCAFLFGLCELPAPPKTDLNKLFKGTKKPAPKTLTPSDKEPLKVLHISDYHLDLRYVAGSEANCTGLQPTCCRVYPYDNASAPVKIEANIFGEYLCDTAEALGTSVFRDGPTALGCTWDKFAFGIFTGDLVSHDLWELTKPYVLAEELMSYQHFFDGLGGIPLYPTLGNHDTFPQAFDAFKYLNDDLPINASYVEQELYNFEALRNAWTNYGWLSAKDAGEVVTSGLGIYRTRTKEGLTIISLNSDVWYYFNIYAYIRGNEADPTGMLATLVDYLLEAEKADDPVWIIQHVNVGGSGNYQALPAKSDLYYQIIDRFNNTIRATFFGHTHSDEFGVFYSNNATDGKSAQTAAAVAYIGPSITPYTNLNAGFRYYLVDAETFNVMDSITYYANISDSGYWSLDGKVQWEFEYSARDLYDTNKTLGEKEPLTPAFWHTVASDIAYNPLWFYTYTDLRQKKYRPYTAPNDQGRNLTLCGLTSMSVPLFEQCVGNMKVTSAFL